MTGNSRTTLVAVMATAIAVLLIVNADLTRADALSPEALVEGEPALKLKASVVGAAAPASMTIELFRWSNDGERAPLVAALAAPPPAPPSAPAAPAAGRAGRAARGGRGAAAAPPPSPLARLTTAIKAAPTVGFIWGDGPTGYSIKYAWRSASPGAQQRVVFVTDRRFGATASAPAAGAADAEFTVVEMRIDGKGLGEGKSSLTSKVVVDTAANTLALDGYADAPVLLKVTR